MQIAVQVPVTQQIAGVLATDAAQAAEVLRVVEESMDQACAEKGRRRKGHARLVGEAAPDSFGLVMLDFRAKTRTQS